MSTHHPDFVGHPEGFEGLGGVPHGFPIAAGAHDHTHPRVTVGVAGVAHEPDGTDRGFPMGGFLSRIGSGSARGH